MELRVSQPYMESELKLVRSPAATLRSRPRELAMAANQSAFQCRGLLSLLLSLTHTVACLIDSRGHDDVLAEWVGYVRTAFWWFSGLG